MSPEELLALMEKENEAKARCKHSINVCTAAGCLSCRSDTLKGAFEKEVSSKGLKDVCAVKGVGCMSTCNAGPMARIEPDGVYYGPVAPENVPEIVASIGGSPVSRLVCRESEVFSSRQHKLVLENSGAIDPDRIEDYIATGGYRALSTALTAMTPQDVIAHVVRSGLRGRGGAGYPTGLKWTTVAKPLSGRKYVICNADEGDPGAFMDRSVLESDPHRVLEGMAIAAYAVGAFHGYVYVRAEYPLAVKRLTKAISDAQKLGLLGNNICGTTFNFNIQIRLGAGAFVCGEETSLIASIEGNRGTPRNRPPYPAESGLWGHPTLINNVETFANIPPIIRNGGEWFAKTGTEKSKGTKVFALAGRVNNTGLIEVPFGITLREIVFDIGGGIPGGRNFKAVQTGGPSGGCIPGEFLDMPVDYESLASVGSIMGSGGLIVMDDTSCMVDVAKYFMEFSRSESCGKCLPCRTGTPEMYGILCRISEGRADMCDINQLEALCDLLKNTSLCGLGRATPNPVISTLRYFRDEYTAHVKDKTCPAGVCPIAAERTVAP
ncbi:MAG TPA: NuoF family protein [Dissulfurispiraceae bacterium]